MRSDAVKKGLQRAPHRMLFKACGLTDEEIARCGWALNETNERRIREMLRIQHGMAAYAKLNIPRIDTALKTANVVADGLYSWEEHLLFREHYGKNYVTVAVYASPATR